MISRVIKLARFFLVHHCVQEHRRLYKTYVNYVAELVDSFMVRGTRSPMQYMLDLRAYGMKIQQATTGIGRIEWQGETVLCGGIKFSLDELRDSLAHITN